MQFIARVIFTLGLVAQTSAEETTPVSKVLTLLADLTSKVTEERANAQKDAADKQAWCKETTVDLGYEIQTEKTQVADLNAAIEDAAASISAASGKLDELVTSVGNAEKNLKEAEDVRAKDASDNAAAEKELSESIDTLRRAIQILERHAGAAMLQQAEGAGGLVQALTAMVDASALSAADASKLTALVQQHAASTDGDEDEDLGAPAGAVYNAHSGGIVDTLEGLLDKAEDELRELRKQETNSAHNFAMKKQALTDELEYANNEMEEQKAVQAAATEAKASDEGERSAVSKDLASDEDRLAETNMGCKDAAEAAAADDKSRADELAALAEATKAVQEATGGATDITYKSASFLQLKSGRDYTRVLQLLRDLAKEHHVPALTQLSTHVAAVMRSRVGGDVFGKVKRLIRDMVDKLQAEAAAETDEKAFCDKETAKNEAAKDKKTSDSAKLQTKIDSMTAKAAKINSEVATLQKDLSKLAKSQQEMDKLRTEEHGTFTSEQADMKAGVEGVEIALAAIRKYYGTDGGGRSSGVIGMLEVIGQDFSKQLAKIEDTESTAAMEYEKQTQANKIDKATKEQDVKYKSKESAGLAKKVSELSTDRDGVEAELASVTEYLSKLADRCIAKPETYEQRKAARDQEIAGLKNALRILQEEASFVQKGASLRGINRH